MSRVVRLDRQRGRPITVAAAIAAFLTEHQLSPGSQRVYAGALRALQDHLGADTSLAVLDEAAHGRAVRWLVPSSATATLRRPRGSVSSPSCAPPVLSGGSAPGSPPTRRLALSGRQVPLDRTRALTREQIASLWRRDDVALRERALWRLLYETAARANEILSLDIEDLDLPNKRARVRSKGGATEWVFWQTGAALLAPAAAGWPHHRPGVPGRSPADAGRADRRPMPAYRPRPVVLPPRRRALQ